MYVKYDEGLVGFESEENDLKTEDEIEAELTNSEDWEQLIIVLNDESENDDEENI